MDFLILFALFLSSIALLCGFILGFKRELHMFQLNGYKPRTHARWLLKKWYRYIPHLLFVAYTILARTEIISVWTLLLVPAALSITLAIVSAIGKAKKPLVFTARVWRMVVTILVICACGYLLIRSDKTRVFDLLAATFIVLYCASALQPIILLLANLINTPIERAINRRYVKDAERILRGSPNLTVIGVTGSFGKTSVKNYLTRLLDADFEVLMTPESYNTTLGVVRTIREKLRPTHQIFVCEMGARNVGDIKEICDLVRPKHGILTAVGEQHLETFKTVDTIRKTKYELADALDHDGLLFCNGDNDVMRQHPPTHAAITYGLSQSCGYRADIEKVSQNGTTFTVYTPSGETFGFSTPLVGEHNVQNIVGAIAVAHSLGVAADTLRRQVARLESVPHRLQLRPGDTMSIIDDAYNSNPAGAAAALRTLALFNGLKVLITPGMVELGAREFELNREFGRLAAEVCDYICLVGRNRTLPIKAGALDAGFALDGVKVFDSFQQAMDWVGTLQTAGHKFVLLENDLPDNY